MIRKLVSFFICLIGISLPIGAAHALDTTQSYVTNAKDGDNFDWDVRQIDDMAVISFGHFSYLYGELRFTERVGDGNWATEVVETGVAEYSTPVRGKVAVAHDSLGATHLLYTFQDFTSDGLVSTLKHAVRPAGGGSWTIETVDSNTQTGIDVSAVRCGAKICACYYDLTNGDLKFLSGLGTDSDPWQIEAVDTAGDVGRNCALAVDGDDQVRIVYFDATNIDLKLATRYSGGWGVESVVPGGGLNYGQTPSIAVAPDGALIVGASTYKAVMSEPDYGYHMIRIATDGTRSTLTAPELGNGYTGGFPAVAVDSLGRQFLTVRRYMQSALFGKQTSIALWYPDEETASTYQHIATYSSCLPQLLYSKIRLLPTEGGTKVFMAHEMIGSKACTYVDPDGVWGIVLTEATVPYPSDVEPPASPTPSPTATPVPPTPTPSPSATPTPAAAVLSVAVVDDLDIGVAGASISVYDGKRRIARAKTAADGTISINIAPKYLGKELSIVPKVPRGFTLIEPKATLTLAGDASVTIETIVARVSLFGRVLARLPFARGTRTVYRYVGVPATISSDDSETIEANEDGTFVIENIRAGTVLHNLSLTFQNSALIIEAIKFGTQSRKLQKRLKPL